MGRGKCYIQRATGMNTLLALATDMAVKEIENKENLGNCPTVSSLVAKLTLYER